MGEMLGPLSRILLAIMPSTLAGFAPAAVKPARQRATRAGIRRIAMRQQKPSAATHMSKRPSAPARTPAWIAGRGWFGGTIRVRSARMAARARRRSGCPMGRRSTTIAGWTRRFRGKLKLSGLDLKAPGAAKNEGTAETGEHGADGEGGGVRLGVERGWTPKERGRHFSSSRRASPGAGPSASLAGMAARVNQ